MYLEHPSHELRERFAHRPVQGVEPSSAKFLFIGLDANYAPSIESSSSFSSILEYHDDGVTFWRRHGVHHPFLLPTYRGDGRRYHVNFSRIGFLPAHADLVSFVELLHVPTVGRSNLSPQDLDPDHLHALNSYILGGNAEHVFVSSGVARLMRKSSAFPWLPKKADTSGNLPVLYRSRSLAVYRHLHFSNYGKFQQPLEAEARAIRSLLPQVI